MRLVVNLTIEMRGLEALQASVSSIAEAAQNANLDLSDYLAEENGTIIFSGMKLVGMKTAIEGDRHIITLHPTAAMIIFIGWLMTVLPSWASVKWRDGWPFVKCPPNDGREFDDGPTPTAPEELELA